MRSLGIFFLALFALCLAQTEENGLGASPIDAVGISGAHVVRVTAWEDANRDGVRQNDENRVAGIYSALYYDSSDLFPDVPSTQIGSEVTGPDGITLYSCVNSGRYSVQLWGLPEGYEYTTAGQGYPGRDSDALVVNAQSGLAQTQSFTIMGPKRTINEIGVGIRKIVTVGGIQGFVWLDANYNGVQDSTEAGQEDVVVSLMQSGGLMAQTTSDMDGIFTFANLTPGVYQLRFDISALGSGFAFTSSQQGTARSRDSDVNPSTGLTSEFQVMAGFTIMDIDAGIVPSPGTLTGFFWLDQNKDGIQGSDEVGISGLQVALLDSAGFLTQTVTTDSEGRFSVVVDSISYYVQALYDDDAFFPTEQYTGTDPSLWSELDENGRSPIVNVFPGRQTSVRGGLIPLLATVEFLVFQDFNENGLYDAFLGDSVFTDYNVTLLNSSLLPISSRLSNGQGIVTFSNLATGSYYIQLSLPGSEWGFVSYRASGSATSSLDSDILTINGTMGTTGEIALVSGQLARNYGAGINRLFSSISGHVFQDFNRNGVKDATDVSMAGVIIFLLDNQGILAQAFTNSAGDYTFSKLDPGTYGLEISADSLEGYKLAPPKQAVDSSQIDSDFPTTGPLTVVLGSNQKYCCADAGLQSLSVLPASIEGLVWDDYVSRTGIQTGLDVPISGVSILLRDQNGNTITTATSNSQGNFFFRDIVPGTYELVGVISAFTLSPYKAGNDPNRDSDFTSFGTTGLFQVIEGQVRTDIDLGLIPKDGVVSGKVWFDSNGDGINAQETALAGVAVTLFPIVNGVRSSALRTVTTSSTGVYSFSPIRPQQYQVYFDKPSSAWTFSPKRATTDTRTDSDANSDGYTDTFTVAPQQTVSNIDAGMRIA